VQVAFPVTEKTNFRLSYAHQVQAPDFGVLMQGLNTDLSITNTNTPYGADLDFARSITFEFGIRHAFSDDMVLDVAAYNKDKLSDPGFRLVSRRDPTRNNSVDLRELTSADFGNSRGLDLRLDRRIGNLFNGTISYSYSSAKNTGMQSAIITVRGVSRFRVTAASAIAKGSASFDTRFPCTWRSHGGSDGRCARNARLPASPAMSPRALVVTSARTRGGAGQSGSIIPAQLVDEPLHVARHGGAPGHGLP